MDCHLLPIARAWTSVCSTSQTALTSRPKEMCTAHHAFPSPETPRHPTPNNRTHGNSLLLSWALESITVCAALASVYKVYETQVPAAARKVLLPVLAAVY
jgi:hypothetical protein